jgi:hypothetical protein
MLNDYLQQTQRFLRDARQEFSNPDDLLDYINRARREVAMRAECVRVLTPIAGSITGWEITSGGSGYTNPTLTVSAPDFPSGVAPYPNGLHATASATLLAGVIDGIFSQEGGAGYFQPTLTITDATGTGAAATPQLSFINELVQGQEVYPFSGVDLSANPGAAAVYRVISISIIYSNYRYSLPVYSFSTYQAQIRQYPFQYQYVPTFASQFGQGVSGSFYVYPLPSQTYQYELDCLCIPSDLTDPLSVEIIPQPWQDAVAYWAASMAFEELQNLNAARYYAEKFDAMVLRYSNYARRGRAVNPYGRY